MRAYVSISPGLIVLRTLAAKLRPRQQLEGAGRSRLGSPGRVRQFGSQDQPLSLGQDNPSVAEYEIEDGFRRAAAAGLAARPLPLPVILIPRCPDWSTEEAIVLGLAARNDLARFRVAQDEH